MLVFGCDADQAVRCNDASLTSCYFEITVESNVEDIALVVVEQDGENTCSTDSWDDHHQSALLPQQSLCDASQSTCELTYHTALPTTSFKVCAVFLDAEKSFVGAM